MMSLPKVGIHAEVLRVLLPRRRTNVHTLDGDAIDDAAGGHGGEGGTLSKLKGCDVSEMQPNCNSEIYEQGGVGVV